MLFFYASVFLVSLLGALSSYTDIRFGKIRNIFVFPAIIAGIVIAVLSGANPVAFFANAFLAFAFGFVLYLARLWSAGDSKLFLAFAILFPFNLYSQGFALFPAFSILLNSFIPAFVVLFIASIVKTSSKEKFAALEKALDPKSLASIAIILFAFYWLVNMLFSALAIPADFFLVVIILFLFISILEKAFPKRIVLVSAILSGLLGALNLNELLQPDFWLIFAFIFISMIFLRFFILYLGFFAFGQRVEVKDLKSGMVLLEGVYEKNGFFEKKKLFFPSIVNALQDIKTKYVFNLSSKGLSEEDVELLRSKNKARMLSFHSLLVQETIPFAPLLFVGTLLTFACSIIPWC